MANEVRLIDANAYPCRNCGHEYCYQNCKEFIEWFNNTVDAVPVVHGEWSTIEDDYCGLVALHCSVCNQEWWFEEDAPIKHYHYCPNCGAKMDGDGNG